MDKRYSLFLSLIRAGYFSIDAHGRVWRHAYRSHAGEWKRCARRRADKTYMGAYRQIKVSIGKKTFYALVHNLVWLYHGRRLCEGFVISHRNRVGDDNRLDNLYQISRRELARQMWVARRKTRSKKESLRRKAKSVSSSHQRGLARRSDPYRVFLSYVEAGYFSIDASGNVWRHALRTWKGEWVPCRKRRFGHTHERGYRFIIIKVNRKQEVLQVSRVVWLLTHGDIPEGYKVAPRNGIIGDNRPANLYLITSSEMLDRRYGTQRASKKKARTPLTKKSRARKRARAA